MHYRNRSDAGQKLAAKLQQYSGRDDVVVLALPRGGVPVGYEVARALDVPLDVFLVRKLGVPGREELAMGAIASGGIRVLNDEVVRLLKIPEPIIEAATSTELQELKRRETAYRDHRPPIDVTGKTVILVDDGLATGSTMRAAVEALRQKNPARVIVAVPVGAAQTCEEFSDHADDVVCAEAPERFFAVGEWYDDFTQTTDDQVRSLLAQAAEPAGAALDAGDQM